ncbi:MAG: cupin domain-containing protein [Clostridia bacterium]|nr:cupin domain-containing protein [Clostridia bacterium]
MQVIKKSASSFELNPAHGGAGTRKLFLEEDEVKNIQGITQSCLPAGGTFSMHKHDDCNECMYVLKGYGVVRDKDGEYPFAPGDFFIFPQGVMHEQQNLSDDTFKAIYIRTK